jgi:hypothetical protein
VTADPKAEVTANVAEALRRGGLSAGIAKTFAAQLVEDISTNAEALGTKPGLVSLTADQTLELMGLLHPTRIVRTLPADLAKLTEVGDVLEDDEEGKRFKVLSVSGDEVTVEEL